MVKTSTPGKVRLIAGEWRGRNLEVVEKPGLRPTPNRVRETLFNWLMPIVSGAKVLDLFAGTGALGYEALSRGASHLTLVEQDRELITLLQQNQQTLAVQNIEIIHNDAMQYLSETNTSFDLIFLDPPFQQGLVAQACEMIHQSQILQTNGFIYIESERDCSIPDYLSVHKQKTSGQVQYGLYTLSDD